MADIPHAGLVRALVKHIGSRVSAEISDIIFAKLFDLNEPIDADWEQHITLKHDVLASFLEASVVGDKLARWCKSAFFEANTITIDSHYPVPDGLVSELRHALVQESHHESWACPEVEDRVRQGEFELMMNNKHKTQFMKRVRRHLTSLVSNSGQLKSLDIVLLTRIEAREDLEDCYFEVRHLTTAAFRAQDKGVKVRLLNHYTPYDPCVAPRPLKYQPVEVEDLSGWLEPISKAEGDDAAAELLRTEDFVPGKLWYKTWLRQHWSMYERLRNAHSLDAKAEVLGYSTELLILNGCFGYGKQF